MAITNIPVAYQKHLLESMPTKATLLNAGVVSILPTSIFSQNGGIIYKKPGIQPISATAANVEDITASTTLTPVFSTDYVENVVVSAVGKAFSSYGLIEELTVSQVLNMINSQIAPYFGEQMQDYLCSLIKGVFDDTNGALKDTHIYVALTASGVVDTMSDIAIASAKAKLGDSMFELDSIIINPDIYNLLYTRGQIYEAQAGSISGIYAQTGIVQKYVGLKTIVNSTLCSPYTHSSGATVYPSYLCGGQPFSIYTQFPLKILRDTNILLAGGTETIAAYANFAAHLEGVSYTGSTPSLGGASKSVLETPTNWTKVAQTGNIKCVKLVTLGK